jgi:probable rRNA maturation factor
MGKNTINIEVFCEDLFFPKREEECPISPSHWQSWCQQWFEILNPNLPSADIYELTVRLTDDLEIKNLNNQFRFQDRPTDVLSFAALEVETPFPEKSVALYLGDVIISVETAKRQARQQKHSLAMELAWLLSHGFLHLLGWDHGDGESLTKMLTQQETLLKKVGLIWEEASFP